MTSIVSLLDPYKCHSVYVVSVYLLISPHFLTFNCGLHFDENLPCVSQEKWFMIGCIAEELI